MFTILCVVLCCLFKLGWTGETGPGLWRMQYITKCEEDPQKLRVEITQSKINRTHDGWNGHFIFNQDATYGLSVKLEVYKKGDGGYRLIQEVSDPEFIEFSKRYGGTNVKNILECASIDPPDFPVPAGEYEVKNYVFDYSQLPQVDNEYGEYRGKMYLKEQMTDMFCMEAYVEFREVSDDDGDDDE